MKTRRVSSYVHFGGRFRHLLDARAGWKVHGDTFVAANVDRVLEGLDEFQLLVSKRAAHHLINFAGELKALPQDHVLTQAEATRLAAVVAELQPTVWAELEGKSAYIVTEKRLQVDRLLDDVGALLAPGTYDRLPPVAKNDLNEAGKCIAFERCTAAAFHLLRGTEAVLRHFYCCLVKRERVDLMWYAMVDHLRRRRTPPPAPLLNNLDNIRLNYRNPTAHPDKIYDIQEAQDLFSLCAEVINRMVRAPEWTL